MLAARRCCLDQEPPSRLATVLRPAGGSLRLWVVLVVGLWGLAAEAAPPKLEYTLDGVSPLAEKRIEAAEDFLSAKQWDEAFRLLDEVLREYRRDLVEAEPGRWVSVPRRVSEITASLEPEGLAAYRQRVDAQAAEQFREAEAAGDVPRLERLVTEFFASTPAEGALWRLGERYWHAGEIAAARDVWRSLIAESTVPRHYPSPTIAGSLVWARMAMCELLLNDIDSANACVARLYDNFPDATGTIGGREGLLKELVLETIEDRKAHSPAGGDCHPGREPVPLPKRGRTVFAGRRRAGRFPLWRPRRAGGSGRLVERSPLRDERSGPGPRSPDRPAGVAFGEKRG